MARRALLRERDGWVTALRKTLSPGRELGSIRALVVLYLLLAYGVAILYDGSLVFLLLSAYGAVVQFMPLLVACLYFRRATGAGALAGLLGGSALTTLFVAFPEWRPFPVHAGLYGVALNVLLLVTVSLATRPPGSRERFLADAAAE